MGYFLFFCVLSLLYYKRHTIVDIIDNCAHPKPIVESTIDYELILFMDTKYKYLHSFIWRDKVHQVKVRDKWACVRCGAMHNLTVHHLKGYMQIPNEPISALALLCRGCHQIQHDIHGYPQTLDEYKNWNVKVV